MIMNLEDRLYTSTEVAEILGVSLRSVYRYLDEDKLKAEVKTATGRHRFTKQNILEFLYPQGEKVQKEPIQKQKIEPVIQEITVETKEEKEVIAEPVQVKEEPVQPQPEPQPHPVTQQPTVEEEPVDWLAKFRAAASKYKEEDMTFQEETTTKPAETVGSMTDVYEQKRKPEKVFNYYRSLIGGLKDIAQNIDKSAKKASIDYAFTMNAGLSLHKPIKPFSILHVYVRPEDREFFERMLNLVSADEKTAQLCLITTTNNNVFDSKKEMHSLSVVADMQLKQDLQELGEEQLARELEETLNA